MTLGRHRHGIVHQDLKLENILISADGKVSVDGGRHPCVLVTGSFLNWL